MTEPVSKTSFRFNPAIELDAQRVVDELGGKRSGQYVMLSLVTPRATLLVDLMKMSFMVVASKTSPISPQKKSCFDWVSKRQV